MSDHFVIKQGDTLPTLQRRLANEDGSAIDLSQAQIVVFKMRRFDGPDLLIEQAATVITPAPDPDPANEDPNVEYAWQADDTTVPGTYQAEFLVDFGSGALLHAPNGGYFAVRVIKNLGE